MRRRRVLALYLLLRRLPKRRSYMRQINLEHVEQRCLIFWRHYNAEDPNELKEFCGFNLNLFNQLYISIAHRLQYAKNHRYPIKGKERLAVFLRFLREGLSLRGLAQEFLIGRYTVSIILKQVSNAIINVLNFDQLPVPTTAMWLQNANEFSQLGFPHAIGCIDGKHFACKKPAHSGSAFYNWKGFFSVVMLAVCDAQRRFVIADIGAAGRQSDSGLFLTSGLKQFLDGPQSNIPAAEALGEMRHVPYVILADNGFGLSDYIMTPFTEVSANTAARLRYNQRLSTARQSVECAFGILVKRFRLFQRIMEFEQASCTKFIHAAIILHNFLINNNDIEEFDIDANFDATRVRIYRNGDGQIAKIYRDKFVNYFSNVI